MPKYSYIAVDLQNKRSSGAVDARDVDDLRRILRSKSLVPVKYREMEDKQSSYRMRSNEVAEFSRQLASMLASGITAVRGIDILKNRGVKPPIKMIYNKLSRDLQQGHTLSESMRLQPNAFPELFVNMYGSGEASGQLEHVAGKMAVHYEKEHRLAGKVKSAMTYPMILLVITALVVALLFTVILPTFFTMFEGMDLPLPTRIIIGLSQFLQSRWYIVLIAALIAAAVFQYAMRVPAVRLKYDLMKLKLPVVGKLLSIIYTARFSRTLSSLYSSGISMLTALEITATIVGSKYIEEQFAEVVRDVRNGETLSDALGKVKGFDRKLPDSILIGEETGRLDAMLESIAEDFDYEAEMATVRMVQLIEPVMLVVMALIIGVIMVSVMMPLMTSYSQLANM